MKWKVVARPQVAVDTCTTAEWYNSKREGLGDEFTEEISGVFDLRILLNLVPDKRVPRLRQ